MLSIERLIEEVKKFEQTMKRGGESSFREYFKKFFDEYPEVEVLKWNQYTPYFNDGDECVFGINDIDARTYCGWTTDWWYEDNNEDEVDRSSIPPVSEERKKEIQKAVEKLYKDLKIIDGVMKTVFGDHVQVRVTRDEIQVEEYCHD